EVIEQSASRVLEAKLVYHVRSQQPGVLCCAGHIAIGLLRGAREGILSKILVLCIDLYAGHGAWTDVGSQHEVLRATELVIDAQAIEAGPLKDRIVPHLRLQTMERGWKRSIRREPSRSGGARKRGWECAID